MSFKSTLLAAVATAFVALPAFADGIMVKDAYARSATPMAKTGAAFMMIMNHSGSDDRLIDARADVAKRVELHTHKDNGEGVMQMLHVKEGFAIADGEMLSLERGGHHVMFMGLTEPFTQDKMVPVTLVFEKAGEVVVEIPVDLNRKGGHGHGHGDHGHKHGDHDKMMKKSN
ncbi:copper chaperone PCu(A)C [Phaeobacter sp. CNT1-3]|jgi:copper(I)-binding protein|nr:copper chaperone PCu(A)C [Phaeobacter sp. CNT1-3]